MNVGVTCYPYEDLLDSDGFLYCNYRYKSMTTGIPYEAEYANDSINRPKMSLRSRIEAAPPSVVLAQTVMLKTYDY